MRKKNLKQVYVAWIDQYEKVQRLKTSLRKAQRQLKILKATMIDKESKGEKIN